MNRYDCAEGFVICADGRPYQACRRNAIVKYGHCGNEYWLATVDPPLETNPPMLDFLMRNFMDELNLEWRHRII